VDTYTIDVSFVPPGAPAAPAESDSTP
jgi:hypothetical protein